MCIVFIVLDWIEKKQFDEHYRKYGIRGRKLLPVIGNLMDVMSETPESELFY